ALRARRDAGRGRGPGGGSLRRGRAAHRVRPAARPDDRARRQAPRRARAAAASLIVARTPMPSDDRPLFTVRCSQPVLSATRQIAAAIKHDILQGVLKPGDKLPSEDELARLFGVSRPTVRAGLQELRAAEILDVQRGPKGGYRVGNLSL